MTPELRTRRDRAMLARIDELQAECRLLRRRLAAAAPHAPAPVVARLVEAAAAEFGVHGGAIYGPQRSAPIALARQVVMHLAVTRFDRSLPQVGRSLARHHTTVLHGSRAIAERIATDPDLAARVARVAAAITSNPTETTA
ncbi:hypothetical protein GXW74_15740 [Roseomonas eburnea]|uniref:Chromosomal replication initiator DnaA C-terminal domain-containing protein n=1 Tax=Neoroseomonas eburnea TaxID=1346889 RepID=A0A9X9XE11_9PROT|nr:helix-turn-helix domain-containing protein [Neoroseomonas eburnea]MBR0681947.1 hypothetical protein [Neoroseomonas eburnea]